ncbi:MAG: 3-isopropylmalate dehydratase [Caldilineaceae bacterium SB0665_bin_21]|nr:3-isopropylmalate dehydratase [Caldilineaceae bacterium SB0665_bin_21]MYA04000.1 3-isopropylmalate dehydratase [Caldilineaceae bacterium SB0664_bin_22]MYC63274.1 3-isopropylmalate dehydratase [Caldilineaceae bacterium SB0661_bin_34]
MARTDRRFTGRIWKYGDNVNTDVIFPGKYTYTLKTPEEIAAHALEDLDPGFAANVQPGDLVVAGRNWGCGSSREQAVSCLVLAGVRAVIARSFSRIWYRNALNNGLLALECPAFVDLAVAGDTATVVLDEAYIATSNGRTVTFQPLSDDVLRILEAGGLIPYIKQQMAV